MPDDFFSPIGGGGFSTEPTNPDFKPPDLKKVHEAVKLPEADRLFKVQDNLLRALNASSDEGRDHFIKQAYKGINGYLKEHG